MADAHGKGIYGVLQSFSLPGYRRMKNIPLLSRVYVWSVVFEPLLFFNIWDEWTTGIGGNISRLLQAMVIIALIFKYSMKPSQGFRIINFANPIYRNYGIYLVIAIFAGLLSALFGGYNMEMTFSSSRQSLFANLLNSPAVRPQFEYFIAIYYFIYFVVLPRYVLKTEDALHYFFLIFKTMFILSLVIGLFSLPLDYFGIRLVPCHISNWSHWAGARFHGLAGEPRHAFIYLFLGLAVFKLESYIKNQPLSKIWIVTIIAAAIFTQSASGLIGIAVFLVLLSLDRFTYPMHRGRVFLGLSLLILTPLFIYGLINSSSHLSYYLTSTSGLWDILESGGELPYFMMVQSPDIYPLYDLIVKARELDILPIIIGSGLGSASVINNHYTHLASGQMINPNSQLVRSLFESGIIGSLFFILSFISPVKQLTSHVAIKDRFMFIMLTWLLIGCFMGIRSAAPFIYLGIFLAVFAPCCKANKGTAP
ncbi:MAG: hypothetical protein CVU54_02865 [Deltaproteobacteria bacterium HGW-Deltaproteobacteria-12]|jgi:hypothetical protein|nr:MAG: hypothetical protein CVU54_02865 [Deltaproteobacteria bacterium HGW-Deltaproteobacteria-12]